MAGKILFRYKHMFGKACQGPSLQHLLDASRMMEHAMAPWIKFRWMHDDASGKVDRAIKVCVVGSGPAGFYVADRLLKRLDSISVDIIDALPTPFGLVRSGVAPDHPDTKNVTNNFTQLFDKNPGKISFMGNIRVGSPQLSLQELRAHYNAIVLAYGAESDRKLGIPGEDLNGVLSAREFVWWYNGHPSMAPGNLSASLNMSEVRNVAVIGMGNVALDCARILLKSPEELKNTDIAQHALESLQKSSVEEVHIVARRGPAQAAVTPKELREILQLKGTQVHVHPQNCLNLGSVCQEEIKTDRIKRRVVEILSKNVSKMEEPGDSQSKCKEDGQETVASISPKQLHFHFLSSPTEIVPSKDQPNNVGYLRTEQTELQGQKGKQKAVGTGQFTDIPVDMVLESVGYRSIPMDGAPFNDKIGIVPNHLGQVVRNSESDSHTAKDTLLPAAETGLFVCGWLKRGPTGIIGTNLVDAEQTVDTLIRSIDTLPEIQADIEGKEGIQHLMKERGVKVIDFDGWKSIDAEERRRGVLAGKPREKIVKIDHMLEMAKQEQK